jgi:hypothetical protein
MVNNALCLCSSIVDVIGWGKERKVDHSEGKGEERVMTILRFQGDSSHMC